MAAVSNEVNYRNSRVLVVDDVARNIQLAGAILKQESYAISFAADGPTAVSLAQKGNIDLILLDIMMPEMDGFDVCEILKQDPVTKDIPIIFLTAKSDTETIVKGFELGAVDFLTKPFQGAELLARVRTHLKLKHTQQELEAANAAKDKFFSIIAHDLRSPFTALVGVSQYLVKGIDNLEPEIIREFLEGIYNSSKNAFNLLENLLEWSRVQTKGLPLAPEPLNLACIVRENLSLLQMNSEKKQITIINELNEEEPAFADENSIHTVVRNLLSNAIKFTPQKGKVKISIRRHGGIVELSFQDTGVGMGPEQVEGLFRIDVRHSSSGTDEEKGSGLGLILCKEFIEKNNGTIEVQSRPGEGSLFTITLPEHEGLVKKSETAKKAEISSF